MKHYQFPQKVALLLSVLGLTVILSGCGDKKEEAKKKTEEAVQMLERIRTSQQRADEKNLKEEFSKEFAASEKLLTEAIAADPTFAKPVCAMGTLKRFLEEDAEAEKHYLKAIKLDPEYVIALDGLGYVQVRLGKTKEARANLEKALEIEDKKEERPHLASIHWNFHLLEEKEGNKEATIEHLKAFMEQTSDTSSNFYQQAEIKLEKLEK